MSWYYITAGLTLWAIDHVIRFLRPCMYTTKLHLLRACGDGNIIHLGYTVARMSQSFSAKTAATVYHDGSLAQDIFEPLPHLVGQFVFINIPEISQIAWHPFTISSAPDFEPLTTHHIKCMGQYL